VDSVERWCENHPMASTTVPATRIPGHCSRWRPCPIGQSCTASDECMGEFVCDVSVTNGTCGFGGKVVRESPHGEYNLVMRDDGNLVVLDQRGGMTWTTGTADASVTEASGNTFNFTSGVVYVLASNGTTLWQSNTTSYPESKLELSAKGLLSVSREGDSPMWTVNQPNTMRVSPNGRCTFGEQSAGEWVLAHAVPNGTTFHWQEKWRVPKAGHLTLTDSSPTHTHAGSLVLRHNETNDIMWFSRKQAYDSPFAQLALDDNCDLCLTVRQTKVWCAGCSTSKGFQCGEDDIDEQLKCTNPSQCQGGLHCVHRKERDGVYSYCRRVGENFCSDDQKCREGEGLCAHTSQCEGELRCHAACVAEGHRKYCSSQELCGDGQGHCNLHNECEAGMRCVAGIEVVSTSPTGNKVPLNRCREPGAKEFCAVEDCAEGQGQCFFDHDCQGQLGCSKPGGVCVVGGDVLLAHKDGFKLVIRTDGNLVVFKQANLIWASGTGGNTNIDNSGTNKLTTPMKASAVRDVADINNFTAKNVDMSDGSIRVFTADNTTVFQSGKNGTVTSPFPLDGARNKNTLRASSNGRCILRTDPNEGQLMLLYANDTNLLHAAWLRKWAVAVPSGGSAAWRKNDGNLVVWSDDVDKPVKWQVSACCLLVACFFMYAFDTCKTYVHM
jgi:hypothetical protein